MDHRLKFLIEQIQIIKQADVDELKLDPDFIRVHAHLIVQACNELIGRPPAGEGALAPCSSLAVLLAVMQ